MASYKNPWHNSRNVDSRPAFTTDAKPVEYRGFLIYQRIPGSFEAVRDGVCATMRAGLSGAKYAIDLFHDDPTDWQAERMAASLAGSVP